MNKCMNEREMDGCREERMYEQADERTVGWIDGLMDGGRDRWMDG